MKLLKKSVLLSILVVALGFATGREADGEPASDCGRRLVSVERNASEQAQRIHALGSLAWFGWSEGVGPRSAKVELELPRIDMVDVNPLHIRRVSGIG